MDTITSEESRRGRFLDELSGQLTNPVHLRLVQACKECTPVDAMESELAKIILEVINHED